jgi:nicotinate-nucleotide adenylyltransferase
MKKRPLGLMGGTFDPVHHAHLRLAVDALEELELEGVRWIPSGRPGHREPPLADPQQRLHMLRLAVEEEPRFSVDIAEIESGEATFTVNTLRRLRKELGKEQPLVMLIGMDSLLSLHTWRDWQDLFELTHFGVADRPGAELKEDLLNPALAAVYRARFNTPSALRRSPCGHIVRFHSIPLAISSTDLRARIRSGRSTRYLIPVKVAQYAAAESLYK